MESLLQSIVEWDEMTDDMLCSRNVTKPLNPEKRKRRRRQTSRTPPASKDWSKEGISRRYAVNSRRKIC